MGFAYKSPSAIHKSEWVIFDAACLRIPFALNYAAAALLAKF
jgi:hypothetical protein